MALSYHPLHCISTMVLHLPTNTLAANEARAHHKGTGGAGELLILIYEVVSRTQRTCIYI